MREGRKKRGRCCGARYIFGRRGIIRAGRAATTALSFSPPRRSFLSHLDVRVALDEADGHVRADEARAAREQDAAGLVGVLGARRGAGRGGAARVCGVAAVGAGALVAAAVAHHGCFGWLGGEGGLRCLVFHARARLVVPPSLPVARERRGEERAAARTGSCFGLCQPPLVRAAREPCALGLRVCVARV